MRVLFSLVCITLMISKGDVLAVRGLAYVHIKTDGLHCGSAKLFALCLFFFVERRGEGRCTDLYDFWEEEAGLRRRWWEFFDGSAASPETQRI